PQIYAAAGQLSVSSSNSPDYVATLVSYKLNLRGPSLTVHTACSTSMVALHLACEALRNSECDMALCGGVSLELPVAWGYTHAEGGIMSPTGHCRAFDASSDGTLWGSGGGMVVLKRLSEALADGDDIRAVVLGNAINNDGSDKVGFSAPSVEGQAAVVAQALGLAEVDPRTVTYVEAHGTGTALGDPIEVAALSSVFGRDTTDTGWCGLGSVKTNIGHLGPAAGMAGLIKTVLALRHGLIPPSLHFEHPHPKIDFDSGPFYVNATLSRWESPDGPRRAGVSSFGIGGTNAHVILEQAPEPSDRSGPRRPVELVQLSARTDTALAASTRRLAGHLAGHTEHTAGHAADRSPDHPADSRADDRADLADVAFTLRHGRAAFTHRGALVARDAADAATGLEDSRRWVTGTAEGAPPRVAFLFSGQGAQYAGMGAGLYATEPVFADAVDECAEICADLLDRDLRELLVIGEPDGVPGQADADRELARTVHTQPALFTVEYALTRLWRSWGIEPAAAVGHSIGEYVAATVAGVFTPADALRLVAARGALMQGMPPGAMLAVQAEESRVRAELPAELAVATVNGPRTCVVAGPTAAVASFAAALAERGVGSKKLRTSHAFHSPMMEPILGEFRDRVADVPRSAPTLPFLSNVTGQWITEAEATDPSYWARHLRDAVRFGDCVATLLAEGPWSMVEVGPGRSLSGLVRMQLPKGSVAPLPSLPGPTDRSADLATMYAAAGRLWVAGAPVDVDGAVPRGRRVSLPTYPYERRYHWVEPVSASLDAEPEAPGAAPVEDWFAVPVWRQAAAVAPGPGPERCLVLGDGPRATGLVARLRAAGAEVTVVRSGERFGRDG
ncbi:MAG TPA: type I polyketide synthase, partial [Mycobacteriales bacterium]|nr:type I polyketide synthase [Mycobacteriales bacterium]